MVVSIVYLVVLIATIPLLGTYMYRVFTRNRIGRVEGIIYRLVGTDPRAEQTWRAYARAVLWFSGLSLLALYVLLRLQGSLPLNPQGLGGVDPYVSFNTSASFVSNTNWQAYGGEFTLSYLSQMLGLTVQNFVTPAVGLAVLVAVIRGFTRKETDRVGNFWVDLTRGTLYILLPLSIISATVLVWQGIPQNLSDYTSVNGIQGFTQLIAQGPAASQIAIKQLGTNGGGFFNINSAHPFENPTPLTNFVEVLAILLVPAACVYMFGRMVKDQRQGWAILAAMVLLFVGGLALTVWSENSASASMRDAGIATEAPNLEGKEQRLGSDEAALWATATTAASNGSVNSMHDSFNPMGAVAPLFNMQVGEVIFGGVGSGLYGMVFYVVLAVFIGGLMVGRTPEYLGKKIGAREIKIVLLAILVPFLLTLGASAISVVVPFTLEGRNNTGPHGFSEILYAWSSMGNNNGSAFAGLTATNWFYAVGGGVVMLASRFVPLLAALALAGSVGEQGKVPETAGTLRTGTPLFAGLLTGVIVIMGGLTFFPALTIGPIVEQLGPTIGGGP
jgi:potassium-transporting ATPase potassium-binding subunit